MCLSTNNGTTWTPVDSGLANNPVWAIAISGTNLFAGTPDSGAFLSTNNGTGWTAIDDGLTSLNVKTFAVSGSNVFAGTIGIGGIFLYADSSQTWKPVATGNVNLQTLAVNDTFLFAGFASPGTISLGKTEAGSVSGSSNSGMLWRCRLSDFITSVKVGAENIPTKFSLQQNYPNPFNPSTTISFAVPSRSLVSLKVFDILGREVSTIVSGELQAGSYTRQWNAANMASGVYFYRLQAGSFTETKKLLLLK